MSRTGEDVGRAGGGRRFGVAGRQSACRPWGGTHRGGPERAFGRGGPGAGLESLRFRGRPAALGATGARRGGRGAWTASRSAVCRVIATSVSWA